jgi:hypothetical protein
MFYRRLLLTAALVGALVLPAAASAQPASTHASARTERLSLQVADAHWLQRGLSACAHPGIEYATLAKRTTADAFVGPNLAPAYCVIRMSSRVTWRGRAGALDFCWAMVHERGHQAGLRHASAGIMRSDGGGMPPAACTRLFGKR